MQNDPLVSVIVTCYNYGRYLSDCLASLFGGESYIGPLPPQTLQPLEVVIVDDFSTDNTPQVAAALQDRYGDSVKYIRNFRNLGSSAANNVGIKAASGQYLTILCADDMRESGSLQRLYEACVANPHRFAYDDVLLVVNGQFQYRADGSLKVWHMADYDLAQILERNSIHCGILFPRQAWLEVGGYPEAVRFGRDDWAMNIALGLAGWCGVHVKAPGYLYRRDGQNRTLTNTTPEWEAFFSQQMREVFPDAYSGRINPMPCCGQRPNRYAVSNSRTPQPEILVGSEGMTVLEYQGGNYGKEVYYGPYTGTGYVFSMTENKKLVDVRDLHTDTGRGLLDLYQNRRQIFREVKTTEAPDVTIETTTASLTSASPTPPDASLALTNLAGIGPVNEAKLKEAGITTLQEFAAAPTETLAQILGWSVSRTASVQESARSYGTPA